MPQKRFLRDHVFDFLIQEVEDFLGQIPEDHPDAKYAFEYINTLVIAYKTNRLVLERIEEAIETARLHDTTKEVCVPLVDAAMHVQTGIRSLHEIFLANRKRICEELQLPEPPETVE